MAEFFEDPEWKRKQNNTLMQQMLSGQKLPYEAAAGQWADALGMMTPGGGFLQDISRRDAIKQFVSSVKKSGELFSKNLPNVKRISKQMAQTPQPELDRINTIGADLTVTPGSARTSGTRGSIDVSFATDPRTLNDLGKGGAWWHELTHVRSRSAPSDIAELRKQKTLAEARNSILDSFGNAKATGDIGFENWMRLPTEQHALAMQYLMTDPEIFKRMLVNNRIDAKMYSELYNAALNRALANIDKPVGSRLKKFAAFGER